MAQIDIILGITSFCLNFMAILIFITIIIIGIKHRQELRDISLLLTYNTCLAALLACLAVCVMTSSNLSNGFLIFNVDFCITWGLLYDLFQCSIYHSYYLQAFYRLCRVVFYKKKSLLSYSLFTMLILGQWTLTILVLLPPIFLRWYVHLPTELYCLVPYTNIVAECYHISVIYMIPLVCIAIAYVWITMFIRSTSRTAAITLAANQRQRNMRDLTVIKRIIVLISILVALRFPTVIFMVYAACIGYLYPYTFGIVGLITSTCMIFVGLMMIYITPKLRTNILATIYRDNRVHTLQQRLPVPTTSTGAHQMTAQQNRSLTTQRRTAPQ